MRSMALSSPTVTYRVVQSVAEYDDTDPLDLPPLYHTIDPDVLEANIQSTNEGEIHFQYAGYSVTVYDDGIVDVSNSTPSSAPKTKQVLED